MLLAQQQLYHHQQQQQFQPQVGEGSAGGVGMANLTPGGGFDLESLLKQDEQSQQWREGGGEGGRGGVEGDRDVAQTAAAFLSSMKA